MITLYLKRLAARRAYSAAQRRDLEAFQAWKAGDRSTVNVDGRNVLKTDALQAEVVKAWRKVVNASEAFQNALDA